MRRFLSGVALSVTSLILLFVLLEAGFRALSAIHKRRALNTPAAQTWAVYDPILGYRLNPDFGDINAHGLRDRPVTPKGDRHRFLMLGDSIGYYGDNVEDTYVGRMRAILEKAPSVGAVDVINASVRGYTTYQQLLYLKHYGLALKPDVVGLGFVLNDLHKFLHSFSVKDGQIVQHNLYGFTDEAKYMTDRAPRSLFLAWLRYRLGIAYGAAMVRLAGGYAFDSRVDFRTAWRDEAWGPIESYLQEIVELGRENGFDVFLVVFPFGQQYDSAYLQRDREYVLKPQKKLRSLCRKLMIPCLDLYPLLDHQKHLDQDQIHLTVEGRRVVAEYLTSFLINQKLVPLRESPRVSASRLGPKK